MICAIKNATALFSCRAVAVSNPRERGNRAVVTRQPHTAESQRRQTSPRRVCIFARVESVVAAAGGGHPVPLSLRAPPQTAGASSLSPANTNKRQEYRPARHRSLGRRSCPPFIAAGRGDVLPPTGPSQLWQWDRRLRRTAVTADLFWPRPLSHPGTDDWRRTRAVTSHQSQSLRCPLVSSGCRGHGWTTGQGRRVVFWDVGQHASFFIGHQLGEPGSADDIRGASHCPTKETKKKRSVPAM